MTTTAYRAAYAKRRSFLVKTGRWVAPTNGDEVRAHIAKVRAQNGMTLRQFATAAGIQEKWFNEVARGVRAKVVTAETRRKILSVTADTPLPPAGLVNSTGTVRRLQALAVLGWSAPMISPALGMSVDQVIRIRRGYRDEVYSSTADKVAELYRKLWLTPPPIPTGRVERIRRDAVERGWKSGACWDDIDDPECKPVGMRKDLTPR